MKNHLTGFALAIGVAGMAVAEAQTVPKSRIPLSRAEIKACILMEDDLLARERKLRADELAHNDRVAALAEEAKVLSNMLRNIDQADKGAVDEYNAKNDARNANVEEVNRRAKELNGVADEFREANADYLGRCASRPYMLPDRNAVLKELGRPAEGVRPAPSRAKPKANGLTV